MSLNLDRSTWTRVRLGDVVKNLNEPVREPGTVGIDRVIAMEHLDPGELRIVRWGDIADGTTFTRRVRPGQTLFGKRRAYQRKASFADFDAVCSGDILVFQADPQRLLPELLPFLVQSEGFFNHAIQTSAGSLSPRTNWKDLSKYEFNLPPIDEQKRIAALSWAGERHGQVLAAEARAVAAAAEVWLVDRLREVTVAGGLRPLGEMIESSAYGPRFSNDRYADDGAYRLLRTTDMDLQGNIDYSTLPRATLDAEFEKHVLRDGDFLISRSGTCGIAAVFEASAHRTIPGAFLIRLRLRKSLMPEYLRMFINSAPGKELTRKLARGGVQKNIRGSSLLKALVPVPEPCQQSSLLAAWSAQLSAVSGIERERLATATTRAVFLNEVFPGSSNR